MVCKLIFFSCCGFRNMTKAAWPRQPATRAHLIGPQTPHTQSRSTVDQCPVTPLSAVGWCFCVAKTAPRTLHRTGSSTRTDLEATAVSSGSETNCCTKSPPGGDTGCERTSPISEATANMWSTAGSEWGMKPAGIG